MVVYAKTLLFTVLVPGTVAGWVPYWIRTATGASPARPLLQALALIPALAGLVIYSWCALDFARAAGTPAPIDPPRELVARGLYRYSRNPMYVGVLSVISAQALGFASPATLLYAALIFLAFHSFVIFYEEPTLARSFGTAYQRYCAAVPRWIPRFRTW